MTIISVIDQMKKNKSTQIAFGKRADRTIFIDQNYIIAVD